MLIEGVHTISSLAPLSVQVLSRTLQPLERLPLGFPLVRSVSGGGGGGGCHGATAAASGRVLVLGAAGLSVVRLLPLGERLALLQVRYRMGDATSSQGDA
jgi:hypothetical protein